MFEKQSERSVLKGMAAGLVGGLVASWVMSQFQAFVSEASAALKEQPKEKQGEGDTGQNQQSGSERKQAEPATVKAAEALSAGLVHRPLTDAQKKLAGPVMHYMMGMMTGAAYGALCESDDRASTGGGSVYGATVWGVADNIAVPALGLSKSPAAYPASTHMYALASHLVYGVTTELVRRIVRRAL